MKGQNRRGAGWSRIALALLLPCLSSCDAAWPDRDPIALDCTSVRSEPTVAPADGERYTVAATDRTAEMRSIDVRGSGSYRVGDIEIMASTGSVEIECESVPLAIYRRFNGSEHRVFQALAVKERALYRIAFYCTPDGALDYVYYSGTDHVPFVWEDAEGRCDEDDVTLEQRVRFPSLDLLVSADRGRITLLGPAIELPAVGLGKMVVNGRERVLHAYDHAFCGSCEGEEEIWHELEALLWEAEAQTLTFVTLAFDEGDAEVRVSPGVSLPDFSTDETTRGSLPALIDTNAP